MRITKRQLRRIIKEEKAKLLQEAKQGTFEPGDLKLISTVIDNLTEMALGYDTDEEMIKALFLSHYLMLIQNLFPKVRQLIYLFFHHSLEH